MLGLRPVRGRLPLIASGARSGAIPYHRAFELMCSRACIYTHARFLVVRDGRDDRIDELERETAQLRALVLEQQGIIEALDRRVRELEARLAHFSGNSSKPSSTDLLLGHCYP